MSTPTNFVSSYDVPLRASKVRDWLALRFCAAAVLAADLGCDRRGERGRDRSGLPGRRLERHVDRARAPDRAAAGLADPAGARAVDDVGDGGRAAPARGHREPYGTDVRAVARGDHVVDEVGGAAGARRPGERGAQHAAAQEQGLAEVRDLRRGCRGGVGVRAGADLQRRPGRDRRDRRVVGRHVRIRLPRVEAGDEGAVVRRRVERPPRLLRRRDVAGPRGRHALGEVAVADVGVARVGVVERRRAQRPSRGGGIALVARARAGDRSCRGGDAADRPERERHHSGAEGNQSTHPDPLVVAASRPARDRTLGVEYPLASGRSPRDRSGRAAAR